MAQEEYGVQGTEKCKILLSPLYLEKEAAGAASFLLLQATNILVFPSFFPCVLVGSGMDYSIEAFQELSTEGRCTSNRS